MTGRLEGKIAIVTGAASGIGRAIVERFCVEGAKVLAVDLNDAALRAAHVEGDNLRFVAVDLSSVDAPDIVLAAAQAHFGRLDILINNAGICEYQTIEETTDALWDRTLAVDLTAVFRMSRAAVPMLRQSGQGRIVNTASIMAERPYGGLIAYISAKHGVAGVTKSLAVELGSYGITANYVMPGATVTGITKPLIDQDAALRAAYDDMGVLGRMAQPEEMASAFLFLASDEASFITGHGLAVDGGALLRM